jgi:hypothetical protein
MQVRILFIALLMVYRLPSQVSSTVGVVMIDKNPQALAQAFKTCKGKILKIRELEITPKITAKRTEQMIEELATAKAVEKAIPLADVVAGQRWYIEGLIKFSALKPEEQLDLEYEAAFADSASEGEMLKALHNL